MTTPSLRMTGICKAFGPIKALVDANLEVMPGTIHGLVGQNGAGKSTIIKVLAGIIAPDAGTIEIGGKFVGKLTPASVEKLKIHFIHQDRLLVPTATVGEAVFLRHELGLGPFISRRRMATRANELLEKYFGIQLPAGALIKDLTTAQQKIDRRLRSWCSMSRRHPWSRRKLTASSLFCAA
jgi:ribose transport system ATP-binding protein